MPSDEKIIIKTPKTVNPIEIYFFTTSPSSHPILSMHLVLKQAVWAFHD